ATARGAVSIVEPVVVALAHLEQRAGMGVLESRLYGGRVAGQAVDPGDQRGGGAGPLDGEPGADPLGQRAVIDGDVRGDRGHVGRGAPGAMRVVLPARLGHVGRTAAARGALAVVPDRFLPASRVPGLDQLGATGRG